MKKLFCLFLIITLSISNVSCTNKSDKTNKKSGIDAKQVKTAEKQIKKAKPNTDYLIISEIGYDKTGNILFCYEYGYDENWNKFLTQMNIYLGGTSDLSYTYEYDNGMISSARSDDGETTYYYTYDENKKMISERQEISGTCRFLNTYSNGNLVETIHYKSDNSVSLIDKYEYNEFSDVIKEIMHVPNYPKEFRDTTVHYNYSYNDNGLKSKCHKSNGESMSYEYDNDGNIIKQIFYDKEGKLRGWNEYKYIKKQNANDYIIKEEKVLETDKINIIQSNVEETDIQALDGRNEKTDIRGETTSHTHDFSDASCTTPRICSCGATKGTPLGHNYDINNKCYLCDEENPIKKDTVNSCSLELPSLPQTVTYYGASGKEASSAKITDVDYDFIYQENGLVSLVIYVSGSKINTDVKNSGPILPFKIYNSRGEVVEVDTFFISGETFEKEKTHAFYDRGVDNYRLVFEQ